MEGLGESGLGRGDSVIDAAAVAVAGDGAVGVPALSARLRGAADAEALAAVVVGQPGEDLLGRELRDLVCTRWCWWRRRNQIQRDAPRFQESLRCIADIMIFHSSEGPVVMKVRRKEGS